MNIDIWSIPQMIKEELANEGIYFENEDNYEYEEDIAINDEFEDVTEAETSDRYIQEGELQFIGMSYPEILYVGCRNPIEIGGDRSVLSSDYVFSASCGQVQRAGEYIYTIKPESGSKECTVVVEVNDINYSAVFPVNAIPNPVPMLGNAKSGTINSSIFMAQNGIVATLENFKLNARCFIINFETTRTAKDGSTSNSQLNAGGRFTAQSRDIINQAREGDEFSFTNIKARCPGDTQNRILEDMIFNIR